MNVFQIKTKPHGIERVDEFINESFCSIGWPGIENLNGVSKDEIRTRLEKSYGYSGHKLGNALGQINAFKNTIKPNDIVFIVEKDMAHIGILEDYYYVQKFDNSVDGNCHRRNVKWINKIPVRDLSIDIQKFLGNRNTICQYPKTLTDEELDLFLTEKESNQEIKKELTMIENDRNQKFNNLFEMALSVLEEELESQDLERRLKAAIEIVRLKNKY